jgi:hypothetical protein
LPSDKSKKNVETLLPQQIALMERDPEFYGRLDKLSRLRFRGNENLFGDLCIEIGAAEHYGHRSILAQILREGKWRTEARDVQPWLRGNLAKRVERLEGQNDFDASGRRRKRGPRFDKRSGVLIEPDERPFEEF